MLKKLGTYLNRQQLGRYEDQGLRKSHVVALTATPVSYEGA